jgi:hypothetical protein
MGEAGRLQRMFPESESYSPRAEKPKERPKRVRDRQQTDKDFQWGDEK